jgi:hypothetical protein
MIRTEIVVKRINTETGEEKRRVITWDDLYTGFEGDIVLNIGKGGMVGNKVLHQSLTWNEQKNS